MRFRTAIFALLIASAGFADSLTLRSGEIVNGTYLGGTARSIKMAIGDSVQAFDVANVSVLQFGDSGGAAQSYSGPPDADAPQPMAQAAPPPPQPTPQLAQQDPGAYGMDIPAGTNFVVRMIDAVDSESNSVGQTFRASLDEPLYINGQAIAARGADVVIKLVDNKQSGKLTGTTQLALNLQSVRINGNMVDINTQSVTKTSSSRGERTAKMAGGGAALGAIIGAIAGGGKGAAIGAGAGAATGAGVEVATKGQKVHVPSETRLTFVLDTPIHI
jgi:hypothetical protein